MKGASSHCRIQESCRSCGPLAIELVGLREEDMTVLLRGIRVRFKCRYVGVVVSFLVRGGVEQVSGGVVCLDSYTLQS